MSTNRWDFKSVIKSLEIKLSCFEIMVIYFEYYAK